MKLYSFYARCMTRVSAGFSGLFLTLFCAVVFTLMKTFRLESDWLLYCLSFNSVYGQFSLFCSNLGNRDMEALQMLCLYFIWVFFYMISGLFIRQYTVFTHVHVL